MRLTRHPGFFFSFFVLSYSSFILHPSSFMPMAGPCWHCERSWPRSPGRYLATRLSSLAGQTGPIADRRARNAACPFASTRDAGRSSHEAWQGSGRGAGAASARWRIMPTRSMSQQESAGAVCRVRLHEYVGSFEIAVGELLTVHLPNQASQALDQGLQYGAMVLIGGRPARLSRAVRRSTALGIFSMSR